MQDLLHWLSSLKGIAVEPGTKLRFELAAFPQGGLALLLLLGLAAVVVGIVAVYRRDAASLPRGHRAVLATLRCLALIAALLIVLEPNLVAVKKEERPGHTILLLDVSQSMGHQDAFRRDSAAALREGWRAAGVEDPAAVSRLELAKAALAAKDQRLMTSLAARNRVMAYGFSSGLDPMGTVGDAEQAASDDEQAADVRLDLGALAAEGRYSNIGGAVRTALERSREAAIAGVVMLTDGRRNMGPQGVEVARLLSQRKVPHTLVLPIGDPSETQTVQLARIEAPEKVFQRDPFRVRAQLLSQGYEPTSVSVRLVRQAKGGTPETVGTKTVRIGGSTTEAVVEFDKMVPTEAGAFTYRVELQPPSGEPIVAERHVAHVQIEVLSEQTRVLLISGGPSHEYRVLQMTLTRDKTIDLSCWLSSADLNFPQDGNTSIRALPLDRREMDEIDVLIMLDADPNKLTPEFCELAAEHVLENGAGLWWVCGEKYTLDALRPDASTRPLAELLPVVPDVVRADREIYKFGHGFHRSWRWELTADGRKDKITKLYEEADRNEALWPRLPGYHLAFPVVRLKPAATMLVRLNSPLFSRPGEDSPLVAHHFIGAGRALFTGTDETYRWRSIYEERYNSFWVKGIRFLFEGRLTAGNSRLRIRVSEDKVELGEAVKLIAEAKDEAYQPLTTPVLQLELNQQGGSTESVRLERVDESPGEYRAILRPTVTGFYTLRSVAQSGKPVETSFQVVPASIEREGPVDLEELGGIASAPGGELVETPQQLLDAIDRIPSMKATDTFRTPHAIWDTWVTVALVLSLLATEWWLRKRFNLL